MKVTLLDHTYQPVDTIGKMAAICYDANTDEQSNAKRAVHCKDKGHLMTMRFAYATVNISGISRVCSHQLVRIAIAGILQESQRYVLQSNVEFVIPPAFTNLPDSVRKDWAHVLLLSKQVYADAIAAGMKKEDARYILPQSCTTQLNMCLNFAAWRDLLNNRTAKAAQWEIREVAQAIQAELHKIAPELF